MTTGTPPIRSVSRPAAGPGGGATAAPRAAPPPRVRLRTVAVPNEHGAWGFWLEPTLLALLVVPSPAGAALAAAGLVAVFAQHPLSLVLADAARGRIYPRTALARRVLVAYAAAAAVLGGLALALGSPALLLPLGLAAPLALVQLAFERRNRGRELVPELLGPVALAALAPAIALAGGASVAVAAGLWAVLAARDLPTVLFVRTRLRLDRGGASADGIATALGAHAVAVAATVLGVHLGVLPAAAPVVAGVLLGRAALGLSPLRPPASAKVVGVGELILGAAAASVLGLAWRTAGG